MAVAARIRIGPLICGFCSSGHHNHCPRAIRNGNGSIVVCNCDQPYCGSQVERCLDCKNETDGEVRNWRCLDREACADTQRKKLDANPTIRLIREVEKRVTENATTEKAARQEKAPKEPTFCSCGCNGATRGGKFLPGHDARFVSQQVKAVLAEGSSLTEDKVLEQMGEKGLTEKLQDKFTKSVKLARADVARKLAAKQEADQKAVEKAQAEAAEKVAKEQVTDQPATPDSDKAADESHGNPVAEAPKPGKTKKS